MKRIFNTSNLLLTGIVVAAAGLMYLGILLHCGQKCDHVAETNDFSPVPYSIPA